jgi:hypothetical protein
MTVFLIPGGIQITIKNTEINQSNKQQNHKISETLQTYVRVVTILSLLVHCTRKIFNCIHYASPLQKLSIQHCTVLCAYAVVSSDDNSGMSVTCDLRLHCLFNPQLNPKIHMKYMNLFKMLYI